MFVYTTHVETLTVPEQALLAVADLMQRARFFPPSVTAIREIEPRPPSATEQLLPGQRIAFSVDGRHHEHVIVEIEEWNQAEARVVERPVRPLKAERIEWRLSELTPGMIRITLTFSADYSLLERLMKGARARRFWGETLTRLQRYLDDKQ